MGTNLCGTCYNILVEKSDKEWEQYCVHPTGQCANCGIIIPPFNRCGVYLTCNIEDIKEYIK